MKRTDATTGAEEPGAGWVAGPKPWGRPGRSHDPGASECRRLRGPNWGLPAQKDPRRGPVIPARPLPRLPACPSGFCPAGAEQCEPLELCFSKWSAGTPIPASQTPESEPAVAGESASSADILDGLVQMALREPCLHTA